MAEFGNFIIYIIMAGTLIGALASIVKPEGELGREFVNGIHAIGPVFLARAGIMAAIPIISYLIMYSIGPFFSALGSDASIAALAVIAVDMGGYQLADAIAANRDMWIVAMLVGYTSGASIVYLIPVGLIMLNRDDHKYLALGAMAGLISIPFAVLIATVTITFNNLPVRAIISTTSPAAHYLQLDFLQALRLLSPLFALCFLLALGLKLRPAAMVKGSDLRQGGGRLYQAGVGAVHHRAFHRRV